MRTVTAPFVRFRADRPRSARRISMECRRRQELPFD